MLATEKKHIEQFGRDKFQKRLVMANMICRQSSIFIGLDKIRNQIAFQAALQATGFKPRALKLSKDCGRMTAAAQTAADELFVRAIEAAKGDA